MNKFISIISLCMLMTLNAFSQIDSVNFNGFKLPDLKRHELTFNYDFSNNYLSHQYVDTNDISQKIYVFGLYNKMDAVYNFYKNTRRYQGSEIFSIQSNIFATNNKYDSLIDKRKNLYNEFSLDGNNRMYFKEKLFYEINYQLGYSNNYYNSSRTSNGNELYYNEHSLNSISIFPTVGIGYGRIEPVTDVVQALYYFKDLKKNNRLQKTPDNDGVYEFAKLLAKLKNERFFDSREKKIHELEKIDSFLMSNNYINKEDIIYFTSINDIWEYGGNFPRYSGKRFSFDFRAGYDLNPDEEYFQANHYVLSFEPYLSFIMSKQVNPYIERNISARVEYYKKKTYYFLNDASNFSENCFYSSITISYGYYPNTRTYLESKLSASYNSTYNNTPFVSSFYLNAYYYISPKFRFLLSSGMNYDFGKSLKYKPFNFFIAAGLQYALL